METVLRIEYRDNNPTECVYVDSYYVKNGCLYTFKRFREDCGTRCIPMDRIREFKVLR